MYIKKADNKFFPITFEFTKRNSDSYLKKLIKQFVPFNKVKTTENIISNDTYYYFNGRLVAYYHEHKLSKQNSYILTIYSLK